MVVSFRWAVVAFLSFRAGSAFQNGCRRSRVSTVSFSKSTHLPYTGEDLERAKRWQNEWREAQESGKFEDLSSDREAYAYSNRRQYQMSSLADQTFATADERRSEEEWNIKMRVARAAATAATDILSSATIAAIATADATIDILNSATMAARATATAAVHILTAATSAATATAYAATDVIQDEVNRKLDKAPASLRERIEASERREKQSTSVLNSVEKKEKIIKAPDNFQLKTRVDPGTERTPVPVLSDVEKSEMNLIALKVAREEQRKRVLLINQKEKRLADMALRSMIEDENNFYG